MATHVTPNFFSARQVGPPQSIHLGKLLPSHVIERGGLYGSFIFDGNVIRFLSTPEIFMMMGGISKCTLPHCRDAQSHLLGNYISVPHATIALINAIKLLHNISCDASVQQQFADVFAPRMTADNIQVSLVFEAPFFKGLSLSSSEKEIESVMASQPTPP